MKIKSFYAFLDGIKRKIKHATSAISGLTNRKIIEKYEFESGGLLELLMITVNNPDVKIKLRYDQDYWEWTPQQLQDYGLTEPSNYLWMSQFDDANSNYTLMFSPDEMLSFEKEVILETFYSSNYDVKQYEMVVYEITNQKEFLTSIQSLNFDGKKLLRR